MENQLQDLQEEGRYKFLLFVSGMSVKSVHAIENLRAICDTHLKDNFDLEIIDISRHKEQAVIHQIVAIPTLIKLTPFSRRTILGDLSNTQKVLALLDLTV